MKTKTKRKRHSEAFKAKVGLEAVIGIKTVAQIAREYSVHPVQVSQWKGVVRQRLPELFETGSKAVDDQEKLVADLHHNNSVMHPRSPRNRFSPQPRPHQIRWEPAGRPSIGFPCHPLQDILGMKSGHVCLRSTPEDLISYAWIWG